MQVILARPRGFCAGVVRAIEIVERALAIHGAPVYVRHEIVHNQHVVGELRAKGAVFVDELTDVPTGAVTIFSAHGVGRNVEAEANARGLRVLDGTCPLVTKVHSQGRQYVARGYALILIGHAGHPEVIGTMGQIDGSVLLVQTVDDIDKLPLAPDARVAYVTQTTLSVDDTRSIIEALRRRFPQIIGPDTSDICYATQNRQAAVRNLCKRVDAVIVVGAPNSSNSLRLREIAEQSGVPSYLVENGSGLRAEWLHGVQILGMTASASAPEAMVDDVISALRGLTQVSIETMPGIEETLVFRVPAQFRDTMAAHSHQT
ncbi:4-hydroxy-3-methylbut-2-enyl diphosphate reductase [Trinickia sp. LjRoot230]|uniref:4-hydroxy-3-methylbut-2-enyl diphosphate reductase n=1 Tax=Trinickia sp. LjRoot230 TaxID=3342288 RepID=UPI003ECEA681